MAYWADELFNDDYLFGDFRNLRRTMQQFLRDTQDDFDRISRKYESRQPQQLLEGGDGKGTSGCDKGECRSKCDKAACGKEVAVDRRRNNRGEGRMIPHRPLFGAQFPLMDVTESSDAYTVKCELPGFDRNDVSITAEDGVLRISGEKREEKRRDDERYHVMERSYGSFSRALQLPRNCVTENASATFENGVLSLRLPKVEVERPRNVIPIN